jgi:hypothetical protein
MPVDLLDKLLMRATPSLKVTGRALYINGQMTSVPCRVAAGDGHVTVARCKGVTGRQGSE